MTFVVLEQEAGTVAATSLEAVTFARGLGSAMHGIVFGEGGAEALAATGGFGVEAGTHVSIEGGYAPAAWARAIGNLVEVSTPSAVVAAGTDRGHELLSHPFELGLMKRL